MYNKYKPAVILLLLTTGTAIFNACHPVYHLASIEKHSTQVQPGEIDNDMDAVIAPYRDKLQASMDEVIGQCAKTMIKERPESTLGNWFGDALKTMADRTSSKPVDFAVQNFGGIRVSNLVKGPVRVGTIYELMPFDNYLVIVSLDSSALLKLINQMASSDGWPISKEATYVIRDGQAENLRIDGRPVDGTRMYRIAMPDYIANGGDNCDFLKDYPQEQSGELIRDGLIQFVRDETKAGHPLSAALDGRIKIIKQ